MVLHSGFVVPTAATQVVAVGTANSSSEKSCSYRLLNDTSYVLYDTSKMKSEVHTCCIDVQTFCC